MSALRRFALVAMCLVPLWTAVSGCATVMPGQPAKKTASTNLQERKREVAQKFDEGRDFAEYQEADASFERGDLKACEETLRRLLGRNPEHADARLLMIDVCLADDRTDAACDHAKQALRAHPNDARVQHAMGLLLDLGGHPLEALAYYKRAAEWAPDNEAFRVSYEKALDASHHPAPVGQAASLSNPVEQASNLSDAPAPSLANPIHPDKPSSTGSADEWLQTGLAALDDNRGDDALECFREAAGRDPQNPQILISAATAAVRHERPDVAVELLRPAERRFAGSAALRRTLALAYYRQADYRAAEQALQQAISLDKSSALAYFLMGCTLVKLGRTDAAEANFRQAHRIDPRYAVRR